MFDLWKEPLTEEERDNLLEKTAHEISKRKLEAPAILFFEMHKPLAYVFGHAALAFSPFLAPLVGFDNLNNYSRLLSDRDNVERLLRKLENHGDRPVSSEEVRC